jgi:cytochrome c biogenesis protein CcmG/thiol:disulfide interchange protein DsbE
VIGSIIAVVLGVVLFVTLLPRSGSGSNGPVAGVGTAAPAFSIPSLTGGPKVDLDALGVDRGHPVVLNFFASWCTPCEEETPLLARTARAERAAGSKIQFIGVDSLDKSSNALPFVHQAGVTYPVGVDSEGGVSSGLYAVFGLPQTYFIAGDGTIVFHWRSGALNAAVLDKWLRKLGGPVIPRGT